MKQIQGVKIGMTQIFNEKGNFIPVTLVEAYDKKSGAAEARNIYFKEGDMVKVSGVSKGKGFQGAVKRWGFRGRGQTHGVKHEHRTIGSAGTSFPERVIKGKKMPGRMGGKRVTVKNLKVVKIDQENGIIALKGALPGPSGALLEIRA